jgi:hypothetical protein
MTKDMDFLFGILTGIGLTMVYALWLSNREKKKKKQAQTMPTFKDLMDLMESIDPINSVNPCNEVLQQRLKEAIASEDYEKAARIRDLIKKA